MTDSDLISIERACARLVTLYCHRIDLGEGARVGELFTDDGVWHTPAVTANGRAEIARYFQRRQQNRRRKSRHICENLLIDVVDENNATGVVYLTYYHHDADGPDETPPAGPPTLIGEYRDTFVRSTDGWRFKRREVAIAFGARP